MTLDITWEWNQPLLQALSFFSALLGASCCFCLWFLFVAVETEVWPYNANHMLYHWATLLLHPCSDFKTQVLDLKRGSPSGGFLGLQNIILCWILLSHRPSYILISHQFSRLYFLILSPLQILRFSPGFGLVAGTALWFSLKPQSPQSTGQPVSKIGPGNKMT